MKTISVKQVAEALDLTPRAVIYRLEKGQLKGTQQPNAFGKQEWRVYPTKEIVEGLKRQQPSENKADKDDSSLNFSPDDIDVVDAVTSEEPGTVDQHAPDEDGQSSWRELAKDTLRGLAEELVRPLADAIREQQELLAEKDQIIADKDRQLKLLPDFQKQAEDGRKAAELKALEAEALKKQIAAMQAQEEEAISASRKVEELEKAMEQLRAEDATKLEQLKAELQQMRTPWWKKMFKAE
ncbi:MAG TPA: hypothetical protein V6C86_10295 [Oculatellaceae cyanobacterium]|jgi:hypothetical protein